MKLNKKAFALLVVVGLLFLLPFVAIKISSVPTVPPTATKPVVIPSLTPNSLATQPVATIKSNAVSNCVGVSIQPAILPHTNLMLKKCASIWYDGLARHPHSTIVSVPKQGIAYVIYRDRDNETYGADESKIIDFPINNPEREIWAVIIIGPEDEAGQPYSNKEKLEFLERMKAQVLSLMDNQSITLTPALMTAQPATPTPSATVASGPSA